jgi:3-deoxy-D-arabino-heptulosonate 7-phosphate (DAHP) synthase class II
MGKRGLTKPTDESTQAEKDAFNAALEAARQLVDRIAFAGQVPVNVMGATAGQYIIPVNDNGAIKGEAVSNPTFEQYQTAVGKVIAIESDGRAKIIVKVA